MLFLDAARDVNANISGTRQADNQPRGHKVRREGQEVRRSGGQPIVTLCYCHLFLHNKSVRTSYAQKDT